jgi:hypothetical protein
MLRELVAILLFGMRIARIQIKHDATWLSTRVEADIAYAEITEG